MSAYGPPEFVLLARTKPVSLVALSVHARLIWEGLTGVAFNPVGAAGGIDRTSFRRGAGLVAVVSREMMRMPSGCVSPGTNEGWVRFQRGSWDTRKLTSELVRVRMKSVTSICCSTQLVEEKTSWS